MQWDWNIMIFKSLLKSFLTPLLPFAQWRLSQYHAIGTSYTSCNSVNLKFYMRMNSAPKFFIFFSVTCYILKHGFRSKQLLVSKHKGDYGEKKVILVPKFSNHLLNFLKHMIAGRIYYQNSYSSMRSGNRIWIISTKNGAAQDNGSFLGPSKNIISKNETFAYQFVTSAPAQGLILRKSRASRNFQGAQVEVLFLNCEKYSYTRLHTCESVNALHLTCSK